MGLASSQKEGRDRTDTPSILKRYFELVQLTKTVQRLFDSDLSDRRSRYNELQI